jgi:hypothetical protein
MDGQLRIANGSQAMTSQYDATLGLIGVTFRDMDDFRMASSREDRNADFLR